MDETSERHCGDFAGIGTSSPAGPYTARSFPGKPPEEV